MRKSIAELTVALAGLGGVGGYCARALHASGIQKLTVSDSDVFEEKNISYQYFASPATVYKNKAQTVRDSLSRLPGSPTRVTTLQKDLTLADAADQLIDNADLVISALDNFPAQSAVGLACEKAGIPFALVSSMGFCIQYTIYLPDASHSYSSAWKHFFRRPKGGPMDPDNPGLRNMMHLQSVLFAVLLGGFSREAIRSMLEHFHKDGTMQFYDLACTGYFVAAMGVLNALRYAAGNRDAVIFPEVVSLDMKHMRAFDGREIIEGITEMNRAWTQGTDAVMACLERRGRFLQ